jgi:hypothetical protein
MVARTASTVGLVLAASAILAGHVLGASNSSPRESHGFGGSWTTSPATARAHLAALRAIESYSDPRTTYVLRRVRCDGVTQRTTACFVAAGRSR